MSLAALELYSVCLNACTGYLSFVQLDFFDL